MILECSFIDPINDLGSLYIQYSSLFEYWHHFFFLFHVFVQTVLELYFSWAWFVILRSKVSSMLLYLLVVQWNIFGFIYHLFILLHALYGYLIGFGIQALPDIKNFQQMQDLSITSSFSPSTECDVLYSFLITSLYQF